MEERSHFDAVLGCRMAVTVVAIFGEWGIAPLFGVGLCLGLRHQLGLVDGRARWHWLGHGGALSV